MSENDVPTEAELRLAGALDRLEAALTGSGSPAALAAKLSDEKTVTAQLSDRITELKAELAEAQMSNAAEPPPPVDDLSSIVAERDAELAEVRAALLDAQSGWAAEVASLRIDYEAALVVKDEEIDRIQVQSDAIGMAAPFMVDAGDLAVLTELTEASAELRAAAAEGAADAGLINRALEAEVEALRVARHADLAEMRTLLAELEPMLEESANA